MDLKRENDVELWWGTPVFVFSQPNAQTINAGLKKLILQRRASTPGLIKSNLGGWHSEDDLLDWPGPEIKTFQNWIVDAFKVATQRTGRGEIYDGQINVYAWANVNGPGNANDVHNHPQSGWSGVYYVDVGTPVEDSKKSGFIHFLDPRGGAGMCPDPFSLFGKGRQFKPMNGQMLLFPSWLPHGVMAYQGEGERISVAFNIELLDLM